MFAQLDQRMLKAFALLVVAVAAGVMIGRPQPIHTTPADVDPPPSISELSPDVIVVHASGEVVTAGLVEVPADARVADVIAAAGGVTARADLLGVNLAEAVVDGQQIVVPSSGGGGAAAGAPAADTDTRIRINGADASVLETLPGVGPVLAGTIIAHRTEYGPFRAVEDLLEVPGIGEQKLASIRDHVIVP